MTGVREALRPAEQKEIIVADHCGSEPGILTSSFVGEARGPIQVPHFRRIGSLKQSSIRIPGSPHLRFIPATSFDSKGRARFLKGDLKVERLSEARNPIDPSDPSAILPTAPY